MGIIDGMRYWKSGSSTARTFGNKTILICSAADYDGSWSELMAMGNRFSQSLDNEFGMEYHHFLIIFSEIESVAEFVSRIRCELTLSQHILTFLWTEEPISQK